MSPLGIIFSLLLGFALAAGLYRRNDIELRPDRRWSPVISPWVLPFFLLTLLVLLPLTGAADSLPVFGAMCLRIFLHMSVYYVLLIAAGPILRRWISARACAALWLLPNLLYLGEQSFMRRSGPRWILHLRGSWLRGASLVWLAGAAAVFLWKCVEHLRFRRKLKDSAWQERDASIIETWVGLQHGGGIKKANIPILRSREIASPLSVGLTPASTFVVLPEVEYSEEAMNLILRHELIHIVRRDAQTKLFLTLCTAVCWFNPLMWIAVRRCAEDLELSCDELVLEYASETEKRRYADLLLRIAGETRGFTSNLSSTASSLRYRLKQIMSLGKRFTGGITAGVILFLLLMTNGLTAFAYDRGTVKDLVFDNLPPALDSSATVELGTRSEYGSIRLEPYTCTDPEAFTDYLFGLKICRLSGNYENEEAGDFLELWLPGNDAPRILMLDGNYLKLTDFAKNLKLAELWYLEEAPDWDYIKSLLTKQKSEDPIPQPPNMEIVFGPETVIDGDVFTATGKLLENTLDGEPSDRFSHRADASCVVEGVPVEWAVISFDIEIPPDELTVTVWNPEMTESQMAYPDESGRIALLPQSAHYTVDARWEFGTDVGMQVYRLEYAFDVGWPKEAIAPSKPFPDV